MKPYFSYKTFQKIKFKYTVFFILSLFLTILFFSVMVSISRRETEFRNSIAELETHSDSLMVEFEKVKDLEKKIDRLKNFEEQIRRMLGQETSITPTGSFMNGKKDSLFKATVDTLKVIKQYLFTFPTHLPVEHGWITRDFNKEKGHTGIDIASKEGTPVTSIDSGIVIKSVKDEVLGNAILIDHGNGLKTLYAHNSKVIVKQGMKVEKAQIISYVGSTGKSTAPHLHYEVWINDEPVNPRLYLMTKPIQKAEQK